MEFSYEVTCSTCKNKFKVHSGTPEYQRYKENRNSMFQCKDCNHKIRYEAIMNFMRDTK